MKSIAVKKMKLFVVSIVTLLLTSSVTVAFCADKDVSRRAIKLEKKADRYFVAGLLENAFSTYEEAIVLLVDGCEKKNEVSCKLASLYVICQKYDKAIFHYGYAMNNGTDNLSSTDVNYYIEALRRVGDNTQAEVVCRNYAFVDQNANQRYLNTLYSLTSKGYLNASENNEYAVEMLDINTNNSEYYVGSYKDSVYYVESSSYMKDPNKIFHHQNKYISITDGSKRKVSFPYIPLDLQNGPMAFSAGDDMIVVTVNDYHKQSNIVLPNGNKMKCTTGLFISYYSESMRGWSKFKPLFPSSSKYSYAYPQFVNNDNSMIFCSNITDGYGGMDLYISHKNSNNEWSAPENMGPAVNTESEEIYPVVHNNILTFSSNGHAGFGGYDIYTALFQESEIIDNSVQHYPAPINTSSNDFGLTHFLDKSYLISDRKGDSSDDIYLVKSANSSRSMFEQSMVTLQANNSSSGLDPVINGFNSSVHKRKQNNSYVVDHIDHATTSQVPFKGEEVLLSLYFDFDSKIVTNAMKLALDSVMNSAAVDNVEEILVVGYADELGSDRYNNVLSVKRAKQVSSYIKDSRRFDVIKHEGRGKLRLTSLDYYDPSNEGNSTVSKSAALSNKIKMYKPARKVDVIAVQSKR